MPNAFSVNPFFRLIPRVVAVLQPWAAISQRLRRIFQISNWALPAERLVGNLHGVENPVHRILVAFEVFTFTRQHHIN